MKKMNLAILLSLPLLSSIAPAGTIKGRCEVEENKKHYSVDMAEGADGTLHVDLRNMKTLKGAWFAQTNAQGELDILYRFVSGEWPYVSVTGVRGGKASLCSAVPSSMAKDETGMCITCELF